MKRTRPNVQAEHSLQVEYLWHLKRYPVLALPTPNGIYFPCRTDDEGGVWSYRWTGLEA